MDAPADNQTTGQRSVYVSFVQAFARCEPALRSFIRPLVLTWDDVDEVIQQTCLVLLKKFEARDPGSDFLSWACTVARFEVLKFRRTRARDRHVFSEELVSLLAVEGEAELEQRERERLALEACVEQLQPRQRGLVRRCYGGNTIKQVAESLGCSPTSLYKALDRIRLLLLECITRSLAQEAAP
jgi:RNA polymerase sigma-70 factor, ECF subfamily